MADHVIKFRCLHPRAGRKDHCAALQLMLRQHQVLSNMHNAVAGLFFFKHHTFPNTGASVKLAVWSRNEGAAAGIPATPHEQL